MKRWLVGLVAAVSVVCMAGVGFSAFTAEAVVYGNASAASVGLQITETSAGSCFYYGHSEAAPGNVTFTGLYDDNTVVGLTVANLTPDDICLASVTLENTGSEPLNVSIYLAYQGLNGVCGPYQFSCYDVFTLSGIQASGDFYFTASPTADTPTALSQNFTLLNPGQSYTDEYGIDIPWGSNDTTPSSAQFDLIYYATVGFDTA